MQYLLYTEIQIGLFFFKAFRCWLGVGYIKSKLNSTWKCDISQKQNGF